MCFMVRGRSWFYRSVLCAFCNWISHERDDGIVGDMGSLGGPKREKKKEADRVPRLCCY